MGFEELRGQKSSAMQSSNVPFIESFKQSETNKSVSSTNSSSPQAYGIKNAIVL